MNRILASALSICASILSVCCPTTAAWSAEGMWTLDHPPLERMQKELGWAPDAAWLSRAQHGSARLANGCSASFVSKDGLVLTNHHCVAECVEQLSTASSDLLKAGFLARGRTEEQRCPAMEVNRLEQVTDVTDEVSTATRGLDGNAFTDAGNAVKARLASACVGSDGAKARCDVVELYHGGQYKLYRYRRFQDVRLAFVPEAASAAFGGDPDNFNFPRFDLDMALIRVYEDGRPLVVTDFFRFNPKGPAAGEPVMVTGHPGSTERDLTVAQLMGLRDRTQLDLALRLAEYRGQLIEYGNRSPEAARTAFEELNGIENYLKVVRGEFQALLDPALFRQKEADEASLRAFVATHPELAPGTAGAWDAIAQATQTDRDLVKPYAQIERGDAFSSTYFSYARRLVRAAAERAKPNEQRLPEYNDNALPRVEALVFSEAPVYPALERLKLTFSFKQMREQLGVDSPIVQGILGKQSPSQRAAALVDHTKLGDLAVRRALWSGGAEAIARSDDPFIRLAVAIDPQARALRSRHEREVDAVIQKNTELIARARFAALGDTIYPDATFTLRLSYGTVQGWNELGTPVAPFTRMSGAFDRATGAEPFALPPSWLAAKSRLDGSTPLDLSSSNDIVGGNSGSPMLDRNGELVGLVFDGNIHSLGGAYSYDPVLNRAVAVDSAGILEALDKIYGAKVLEAELRGR